MPSRVCFLGATRFCHLYHPLGTPAMIRLTTTSLISRLGTDRLVVRGGATATSKTFFPANPVYCSDEQHEESRRIHVESAHVMDGGRGVQLVFTDPKDSTVFHAPWLWSNDPEHIHPTSGQRTRMPISNIGWKIMSAEIVSLSSLQNDLSISQLLSTKPPVGCFHPVGSVYQLGNEQKEQENPETTSETDRALVKIKWHNQGFGKESTSYFSLGWLLQHRYDEKEIHKRKVATFISRKRALRRGDALFQVDFAQWENDATREETVYQLLDAVFCTGAAFIKNAPPQFAGAGEDTVGTIGKSLSGGQLSHGSLYGEVFRVESKHNSNNIAYTNIPLPPHQDLAYYESKPGLQLLHCINNRGVTGGSSVLIDALAAAEWFKQAEPDLYKVLLRCEATFVKQRSNADMAYRRPHIEEDSTGSVTRVTWSPPFEGPLCVHPHLVEDYYLAYSAFHRLLDNSLPPEASLLPLPAILEKELVDYAQEFTWDEKLEMGDVLIFSNERMLHGRRGFDISNENEGNGRTLTGCYCNIDETLNRYRMLRRNYLLSSSKWRDTHYLCLAGNGSSSNM